jgi:hypothetical protein
MFEVRTFFDSARPLGAPDPVTELREGESISDVKPPKRAKRGYYVDLLVENGVPDDAPVHLGFLVSKQGTTRLQGERERLRLGLYRRARMEALARVLEIVGRHKPIPEEPPVSYQELMSHQEYVEDMRVGPAPDNPESLAFYALIKNREGEKVIAFAPEKKKIVRVSWDDAATIEPVLFRTLHVLAQKELRRLGVPA